MQTQPTTDEMSRGHEASSGQRDPDSEHGWDSAMTHLQLDLARERQRSMLQAAQAHSAASESWRRARISRRAERAERMAMSHADRAMSHADRAERLRHALSALEPGA